MEPSCSSSITNSTNNVKNSELDENHPTLFKQDMRRFSLLKYEQSFPWLYNSCIKSGYLCKYCELFQKEVFQSVHTDQALLQTFPNVYKLLYLMNIIPASIASVERSFSYIYEID
jgi:thioredoxin-related protein